MQELFLVGAGLADDNISYLSGSGAPSGAHADAAGKGSKWTDITTGDTYTRVAVSGNASDWQIPAKSDLQLINTNLAQLNQALQTEIDTRTGEVAALDGRVDVLEAGSIMKDGSVAFTGDQSMGNHRLTNVAAPQAGTDGANREYVDQKVAALGAAFEYVGELADGGATAQDAFDLATLSKKDTGDYYKVTANGYFKLGTGDAFFVKAKDGLVFNSTGGVDLVDNTNSEVMGTTNFVTVTGSTDTGFTVDVASQFKDRVTAAETGLAQEVQDRVAQDGILDGKITAETTRAVARENELDGKITAEVARATGREDSLNNKIDAETARATGREDSLQAQINGLSSSGSTNQAELDATQAAAGLEADGTFATVVGSNFLGAVTTLKGGLVALDGQIKNTNDALALEIQNRTQAVQGVAANLAQEILDRQAGDDAAAARLTTIEASYIKKDGSVAFIGNQSMGGNKLTNMSLPEAKGDAANKDYVDQRILALGNAFDYVGTVTPGATEQNATDLDALTVKHAGAYYKVTGGDGYFKFGTSSVIYAKAGDAIVANNDNGWDHLDYTDAAVFGTTNQIAVTGDFDAGFTIALDTAFLGRVSTLETGAAQEVQDRQAGDANLHARIDALSGGGSGSLASLATELDAVEAAVGLNADGTFNAFTGTNYLNSATSVTTGMVALDGSIKTVADGLAQEVQNRTQAVQTLGSALAQEVQDRTQAVQAEAQARSAADDELRRLIGNGQTVTNVTNVTGSTVIDSFPLSASPASKWIVTVTSVADPSKVNAAEVFAVNNGASVDYNVYAKLKIGAAIAGLQYEVVKTGTNVELRVSAGSEVNVKASRTLVAA